MIKEAYCSFEVSKLLKKKGFDGDGKDCECHMFYCEYTEERIMPICEIGLVPDNKEVFFAPTHQMACAWLRKKGYHIAVLYQRKFKSWERIIQASTGVEWSLGGFGSHDEAVEEGIKYALEVLI